MNIQSAYQEELEHLERTIAALDAKLKKLEAIPRYYGDDLTEQAIDAVRENARRRLASAADEPYFGRIDFHDAAETGIRSLYIGKTGIDNDSGDPLVIDWRAPVASLFYSFSGGDGTASYESPDGTVEGLVYLKRSLSIRKRILQRVVDTYDRNGGQLAVNDEFLLYRLGENKDNKLRDIVSTIQAEQDRIIRSAKNTALVIQGVAGSGKTTVALHRLAYLLYQYREQIRADRMVIFAPNRMFLDYISAVLPELGVGHIHQTTFEDWVLDSLPDQLTLADESARLSSWFAAGGKRPIADEDAPGRFKGSARFMKAIEEAFAAFGRDFVPDIAFEPWEGERLEAETIRGWFYEEYRHYPVMKRKERLENRIKRWIAMRLEQIYDPSIRKDRKKKAGQKLRSYWKLFPDETPYTFYQSLFPNPSPDSGKRKKAIVKRELPGLDIPQTVAAESWAAFRRNSVYPEDLAPLMLLNGLMYGIGGDQTFDHIVIDEAQDFSPFQIRLLQRHVRNGSFTILGDLSQAIHVYKGIRRWDDFLELFDPEARQFFALTRSYRSTMEIVRFANIVLSRGLPDAMQAEPVFRSGEKVKILRHSAENRADTVIRTIRKLLAGGRANTIAVIGRTDNVCREIHALLLKEDIPASLIGAGQQTYEGGLSVVPVYLAKGLEFDAAVIIDVNKQNYGGNEADARLLYVACTRALHELWLLHEGSPSPLLPSENSDFVKITSVSS